MDNLNELGRDLLLSMYTVMVRGRKFDEHLIRLIQEGKISGFYHSGIGHEAIGTGACLTLRKDDYIMYNHRGCTQMIAKGVPLEALYGDFLGTMVGTVRGKGAGIVHSAWPAVGVLGQSGTLGGCFPIAFGAGLSAKMQKQDRVVVCFFGDGTINRGTFHESMNICALWKIPVVFLCENNFYAISNHVSNSSSVPNNLADRAWGYNVPGVVIDGNDPALVYQTVAKAVARARAGEGPTLIEAQTYRLRGHHEGDPQNYRQRAEIEQWKERDPLLVFPRRLIEAGVASQSELEALERSVEIEVVQAAEAAGAAPKATKDRVFEDLYSE